MKTIWKYRLDEPVKTLALPAGAKVLAVQMQNAEPTLWVLVDPRNKTEQRTFVNHSTGHTVPDTDDVYCGTLQAGPFVWHIFERRTDAG